MRQLPVITLDGPAGSGKSTTAREVARRLGFLHLDSGALYRALTFALLSASVPKEDWAEMSKQDFDRFRIWLRPAGARFEVLLGERVLEEELRTPEVTALVSPLSALPSVREWLLEAQRQAGRLGGLVADGRDMGTVVFPDAEVKIYLTANLKERAFRRFLERKGREPSETEWREEAEKIRERDERDSSRVVAPLKKAPEAIEVDTSFLTFEAQVEAIINHVKALTAQ
jgi:cytidylate kinase